MTSTLALLLALGSATWLDVPFVRQPKDGCGSASIWMLMQYWRAPQIEPLNDIHRDVFSSRAGGVYAGDMQRYFASHGFDAFAFSGQWTDLQDNLAKGRPLIVSLEGNARDMPLHYVVVAGLDDEQQLVLLNDAADRKLRAIRRTDFEERWQVSENWTLLVTPRESEPAPAISKELDHSSPEPAAVGDLEAATAAFRREDYPAARRYARSALRKSPQDVTANDLLATLFLLDDNLEAALKYWNRLDKPAVRDVRVDPPLRFDPVRLDRAFAFSRGGTLTLDEYRRTAARLDAAGSFSRYDFDLSPTDSDSFDLTFRASERSEAPILSWFAGLPFQTVQPRATDIGGSSMNVESLLRWDRVKQRAFMFTSGPLGSSASTRYFVEADARKEEWDWRGSRLVLKKFESKLGLSSPIGSRGAWSSAVIVGAPGLGYAGQTDFDVLRWPERRLVLNTGVRAKVKRVGETRFARAEFDGHLSWFPRSRGSDFATTVRLRAGAATGQTPYDELFALGIDRDSDLILRGHRAVTNGRKGSAVFARHYGLLNLESEKTLHDFTLARLSAAPFVDAAKAPGWFVDTGVELRLRLASVASFSFSIGRDLQTGRTVYAPNYH